MKKKTFKQIEAEAKEKLNRDLAKTPRHLIRQHTPGPWCVNSGQIYDEKEGDTIAIMQAAGYMDPQDEANASLISAAPDLLEALKTITEYMREDHAVEVEHDHYGDRPAAECTYCQAIRAAEAAIAKAEGR